VPFGRGRRVGIVIQTIGHSEVEPGQLKSALAVLDDAPALTGELLGSLQWAARYYQHPLGEVLDAALPAGLREAKPLPQLGHRAIRLTDAGRLALTRPPARAGTRTRTLLESLAEGPRTENALDQSLPGWRESAAALRQRGLVETMHLADTPLPRVAIGGPPLNEEQRLAIETVDSAHGTFKPFLLEGVTGSGKTEVYLELVKRALERGKQSLVRCRKLR
jgi:primosomal protein N' (replication factor Y)